MTPSGIEPVTFRFVAQYLNHCATISGPQCSVIIQINIFISETWISKTLEAQVLVKISPKFNDDSDGGKKFKLVHITVRKC
jgi:hypothetical protein